MNNIIEFPQKEEKSFEKFETEVFDQAKEEADQSAEKFWASILLDMNDAGFNLEKNSSQMMHSSILILESIRALHYLTKGIEHPLQEIAEEMFEIEVEHNS
jgi:hypothetical protein